MNEEEQALLDMMNLELEMMDNKPITYHIHDWRDYIGFTDVYKYCDCGEKKYEKI